jgi:membrane protease YdiL (CAAX protease family)
MRHGLAVMVLGAVLPVIGLAASCAVPRGDDPVTSELLDSAGKALAGLLTLGVLVWWKHRRLRPETDDFALIPSQQLNRWAVVGWWVATVVALRVLDIVYAGLFHPAAGATALALGAAQGPQMVAFAALMICIAPVIEEALCRGVLYRALRTRCRATFAAPVSSLVFVLPHLETQMLVVHIALGLGLCILVERTGSLLPAIMLHSIINAAAFAAQHRPLALALALLVCVLCFWILSRPGQPISRADAREGT